jgi:hypothetical protein
VTSFFAKKLISRTKSEPTHKKVSWVSFRSNAFFRANMTTPTWWK